MASGVTVAYRHAAANANAATATAAGGVGGPFMAHALRVADDAAGVVWRAGDAPTSNLGGTLATLSGVDGALPLNSRARRRRGSPRAAAAAGPHAHAGRRTRGGWAVVDDTFNAVVEASSDWVEQASRAEQRRRQRQRRGGLLRVRVWP